jgi:hypothetical protein
MIAPLILKREHNLHSAQSTTYHKMRKGSLNILSLQLVPRSYCQKEGWIFANVC